MADAPTPRKGHRANHKSLAIDHTRSVLDQERITHLSDFELINRLNMQMKAKPISSDAAHTSIPAHPIPTQPAGGFFPGLHFKM